MASVLIGGTAGQAFAACFAAGVVVVGFTLWRIGRAPRPPREIYTADHRPPLVFRADPPIGMPGWYAAFFLVTPFVKLVGDDDTWTLPRYRWKGTYAVEAPPGAYTLEISTVETWRIARLDVILDVAGRLYVEYAATWWFFRRGTIRWQPTVPEHVVIDGTLQARKVHNRRTPPTRSAPST